MQMVEAVHVVVIGEGVVDGENLAAQRLEKKGKGAVAAADVDDRVAAGQLQQVPARACEHFVEDGEDGERRIRIPLEVLGRQLGLDFVETIGEEIGLALEFLDVGCRRYHASHHAMSLDGVPRSGDAARTSACAHGQCTMNASRSTWESDARRVLAAGGADLQSVCGPGAEAWIVIDDCQAIDGEYRSSVPWLAPSSGFRRCRG